MPKGRRKYWYNPLCVFIVAGLLMKWDLIVGMLHEKYLPPANVANKSSACGRGYWSMSSTGFTVTLKSP